MRVETRLNGESAAASPLAIITVAHRYANRLSAAGYLHLPATTCRDALDCGDAPFRMRKIKRLHSAICRAACSIRSYRAGCIRQKIENVGQMRAG